ncbi:uncharacterized protein LOC144876931 [Branchiostoma floridae x Branchiostoma japonicum]
MDSDRDNLNVNSSSDAQAGGNHDCSNKEPVPGGKHLMEPCLGAELELNDAAMEDSDTRATCTLQANLSTTPNALSFTSRSVCTKAPKTQGEAMLAVAEQTTAYNVQLSSNNPATIEAMTTLQPGQGKGSMIVIEQPDQVIIQENIKVKDSFAVQVGQHNMISSTLTDNSQGSALVGATSAVSPPQLVIRKPGTVLLYSKKDIEGCEAVQLGDNNVMGKLIPQEDAFVRACCELDIDPEKSDDIYERLSHDTVRQQFATLMAEWYSMTCKLKSATKGCILLELEVPTEEDRLKLLRMARDGTFQQVLLETFLPEFAAEGRAVNMNLAIGVRNPSQAMVEELQGAVASSGEWNFSYMLL